jgi:putative restriction endonuclease
MGINLIIAVTDGDWHEMLRRQPDLGEVNFWAPSATKFRALEPGELFLFTDIPHLPFLRRMCR